MLSTTATLTVNATHGSVTKDPDQATYALGTDVTLTPFPRCGLRLHELERRRSRGSRGRTTRFSSR
jgi:hypothetical protein